MDHALHATKDDYSARIRYTALEGKICDEAEVTASILGGLL
jgi:hypothetical protein